MVYNNLVVDLVFKTVLAFVISFFFTFLLTLYVIMPGLGEISGSWGFGSIAFIPILSIVFTLPIYRIISKLTGFRTSSGFNIGKIIYFILGALVIIFFGYVSIKSNLLEALGLFFK